MKQLLLASVLCLAGFTNAVAQEQQPNTDLGETSNMLVKVTCMMAEKFLENNARWEEIPMFKGTAFMDLITPTGQSRQTNGPMMIFVNLDTGTYTFVLLYGEKYEVVCPLTGGIKFTTVPSDN